MYIQCERLCCCSVENIFCGFSLMKHMLLIISNTFFTITISALWKRLDVCCIIYILLQMSPLKTHNHFMKKYFSSFNNYCTQKTKESQSYVFHPKPGLTSFRTNRIFFIRFKKKKKKKIYHSIPFVFLSCLLQLPCLFWVSLPVEYSVEQREIEACEACSALWLSLPVCSAGQEGGTGWSPVLHFLLCSQEEQYTGKVCFRN